MLELNAHLEEHLPKEGTFDTLLNISGKVYREVKHRRTVNFQLGNKNYFIKIHRGAGWREIFKELLQGRLPVVSAASEWRAVERLKDLQLNTLKVVGKGIRGWNPASLDSFIVTEALEGMITLEDLIVDWVGLSLDRRVRLKRILIKKLAEVARILHKNGLNHRDFYLCHFLVKNRNWADWETKDALDLYLIDLHRMQMRRSVPERWKVKDLGGLLFSAWDGGITHYDIFRFVTFYEQKPLRECFCNTPKFWLRVLKRAISLYRSAHGRTPQLQGFLANFA